MVGDTLQSVRQRMADAEIAQLGPATQPVRKSETTQRTTS